MAADRAPGTVIARRVFISTLSNYIAKVYTLGIWFFLTPFLLRELGASDYGLYVLVGSVVTYGALLDFGIAAAVSKYVAEYHARGEVQAAGHLIATALWLYSGLGAIAILASAVLAPLFPVLFNVPPEQHAVAGWLVLLSGLNLGISLPCALPQAVLRGLQRFDLTNTIGILGMTLFTLATVGVVLQGWGLLGMMAVSLPVTLVIQIPSIWLVRRVVPELHWGWGGANRRLVRTVTSFSWALFVINLSGQIQTKTDEIVIGVMLPVANVTPYSIARRLSELPQILTDQFMKVLLPLASQLYAQSDHSRLRALYLTSTRLTLAIFVPFASGIIILAPPFLAVWVGAVYADYAYLVVILTIASLINTSQWPAGSILQGMARHRPLSILSLGSALANLGLSLLLVRYIGLAGVALGTLIPTAVECIGFVLPYALRVNRVGIRAALDHVFLPTLIPALPMALVVYALRETLQPNSFISIGMIGGSGLLVYGAVYLLMGAQHEERLVLFRLTRNSLRFVRTRFKPVKVG